MESQSGAEADPLDLVEPAGRSARAGFSRGGAPEGQPLEPVALRVGAVPSHWSVVVVVAEEGAEGEGKAALLLAPGEAATFLAQLASALEILTRCLLGDEGPLPGVMDDRGPGGGVVVASGGHHV